MNKISIALATLAMGITPLSAWAQDTLRRTLPYDPHEGKLIPDKAFEIGIPALLLFLLLNTIVTVLNNRSDARLKQQMIERGVSDDALTGIFNTGFTMQKLQPLKYAIYSLALALSFGLIHLLRDYLAGQDGYLAVSIVMFFTSAAAFAYHLILQRHR